MEKITIISLIYQSCEFVKSLYENLLKHTPELHNGEADFYFVANDATEEVLKFLSDNKYPHIICNNHHYTEAELFSMGYAFPEYINRVYAGYNFGIKQTINPIVVLINSDNFFSPNWLGNLKKRLTYMVAVSPIVIQPCRFTNPRNKSNCKICDFGTTIRTFNEEAFLKKADELRNDNISIGNLFMPVMIYKCSIEMAGYFPEGNLHNGNYNSIKMTGDAAFFDKLESMGIMHICSNDSIIYHLNIGEKENKI